MALSRRLRRHKSTTQSRLHFKLEEIPFYEFHDDTRILHKMTTADFRDKLPKAGKKRGITMGVLRANNKFRGRGI